MSRFSICSVLALCICSSIFADPPVAVYVFPAGGQKGTTVKAHVGGMHLNETCPLEVIGTGIAAPSQIKRTKSLWFDGPVLPLPESQRQEDYPRAMAADLKLDADATPGVRHLRMWTAQGVTLPLKFVVGDLPEVVEEELDGKPIPVPVTLPVTVNGRSFPSEDVDVWAVTLKKGEVLTVASENDRIKTPMEPHITLRTPDGRELAEAEPRAGGDVLLFNAPADGIYHVQIRDSAYKGGPGFVYRFTMTTGAWVDWIHPLGGQKGTKVVVRANWPTAPMKPVEIEIPKDANGPIPVKIGSNTVWLDTDDFSETDLTDKGLMPGGQDVAVPGIANGCIAAKGMENLWAFDAKKGQNFEVELRAARLGSPLIGVLTVVDPTGKEVATAEPRDAANPDPEVRFTAAVDGKYRVRVKDKFRSRGGPSFAYRLKVRVPQPGFELEVAVPSYAVVRGGQVPVKVAATRFGGYNGPITLRFEGLPEGVAPTAPPVIQPGQNGIDVQLKADVAAKIASARVRVVGTGWANSLLPGPAAPFPGKTEVPTQLGETAITDIRVAVTVATPFKIIGDYSLSLHPRGTRYTKRYRVERKGYDGPILVELAENQSRHLQGVTGPAITVPAGATEFDYTVDLPPWMETARTCRVCVMGTATIKDTDGSEHVVTYSSRDQNDQMIAVVEPGKLGLELDAPSATATPGGTARVGFHVTRAKGITGPAKVEVIVPPMVKGVAADRVEVKEADGRGEIVVKFGPTISSEFAAPLLVRVSVDTPTGPVTAEAKLELVRK